MASSPRIDPSVAAEIDRLATALAKDPRSKVFLPLADEYIKAGMWQEAAAVLEDGLKAYPTFVTAMAALGRVYDRLGQPGKAKAILEDVVKLSPDNLRAHRILAKVFAAEGQTDLALRSCTAILDANPSDAEALSIKRSISGAPDDRPRPKRDNTRISPESKPGTLKKAVPLEVIQDLTSSSTALQPERVIEAPIVTHAATVARLEAWLRTIQTQRKNDSNRL